MGRKLPSHAAGRRSVIANGGGFSIRLFSPCTDASCAFSVVAMLKEERWYPSSQLLPDGRVIVVGGSTRGSATNSRGINQPSLEYFPRASTEGSYFLQFLQDTLPFNLYPFLHLLPNGQVFIFAGASYILWDTASNKVAAGDTPRLNATSPSSGGQVQFNYPVAATTALLPLSAEYSWHAEVIICGGGPAAMFKSVTVLAEDRCWRISPLDEDPGWTVTDSMSSPRVMPIAVLLPDGNMLVHGGASYGHSGFPNTARRPILAPEMLDTRTKSWYTGDLGVSKIVRLYHASGVLLHDATVLFTGSNPNANSLGITRAVSTRGFPTEFRSELYSPPYFQSQQPVPVLVAAPDHINTTGSMFNVTFIVTSGSVQDVSVVLAQPGFSTHGSNHGMRNVVLEVTSLKQLPGSFVAFVLEPPDLNVCPPTWYWLFVLVNGVPNREGMHVLVS